MSIFLAIKELNDEDWVLYTAHSAKFFEGLKIFANSDFEDFVEIISQIHACTCRTHKWGKCE